MDAINRKQIEEMLAPVERAAVVRHDWLDGHFNDHCLVTTANGNEYVLRISRQGWDQTDWKVGKFIREKAAADLIGDALQIATPRTYAIDGSLTVYPRVYAVQKMVKEGKLFFEALKESSEAERRALFRLYGATARRIHAIQIPKTEKFNDWTVLIPCEPLVVRCELPHAVELRRVFSGARVEGKDETWITLGRAGFHAGEFLDTNLNGLLTGIRKGIQTCRDNAAISPQAASALTQIIETQRSAIESFLSLRSLCHGDYHFGNLRVKCDASGRWELAGILDLEIAFYGPPLQEFVKAEQYSFEQVTTTPGFRADILEGYGVDRATYALSLLCTWLVSDWGRQKIKKLFAANPGLMPDEKLEFMRLW